MNFDLKFDKALPTTKEDIDFVNSEKISLEIEITKANHFTNSWYDKRIGQIFKVRKLHSGIPNQYEVDLTALYESGEETVKIGYVPFCDAKVISDI